MSFWRKIAGLAARNLDEAECDVCPPGLPGEDRATPVDSVGVENWPGVRVGLAPAPFQGESGAWAARGSDVGDAVEQFGHDWFPVRGVVVNAPPGGVRREAVVSVRFPVGELPRVDPFGRQPLAVVLHREGQVGPLPAVDHEVIQVDDPA